MSVLGAQAFPHCCTSAGAREAVSGVGQGIAFSLLHSGALVRNWSGQQRARSSTLHEMDDVVDLTRTDESDGNDDEGDRVLERLGVRTAQPSEVESRVLETVCREWRGARAAVC